MADVLTAAPEPPEDDDRNQDEFLTDDDTPVKEVPPEEKRGRPQGMTKEESAALSAQIWQEYAGGMGMKEIGDLHGMTLAAVSLRIRKFRKTLGIEDIDEAKALDLGRYEALIERVWKKTFENPTPENVRSMALLMDQRAKLLGLNAPKQVRVDGQVAITPSPAMVMVLDRLAEERGRLEGELNRPQLTGPIRDGDDVVEAELVDDSD